ncbi:DUF4143 domain-containing protein [Azohydromonas sediminis]|uniref:DUF4143 domain-containing protein n=1 Tax=Azohydromonas sediminis TaxID=2259674 RepID=UPI001F3A8B1D|nr:DUF4143 domain-containing protein [Azohydromonas sediminis]
MRRSTCNHAAPPGRAHVAGASAPLPGRGARRSAAGGKTTLARAVAARHPGAAFFDLERESDRAALGGAAHTTIGRYLDTLVDALMVRRLQPVRPNVGKRLVKSPKVYVRDSGLLHALLGITDVAALQGHPVAGASWEGFVVEQVAGAMPADATLGFYRTAAGAEIDLVVEHRGRRVGFAVEFSAAPRPARGLWQAPEDLRLERAFVVAPVARRYPLEPRVEVVGLNDLAGALAGT